MNLLGPYIAGKQVELARHRFFRRLESSLGPARAAAFVPDLMSSLRVFRDILRLNETFCSDPPLSRLTLRAAVDAERDRPRPGALAAISVAERDIQRLWGARHARTRDAAHALLSEVFRAWDDRLRLVLLMALESAGQVLFERITRVLERTPHDDLYQFAAGQLRAETDQAAFERQIARKAGTTVLAPPLRREAEALIDRCFAALRAMLDALLPRSPGATPTSWDLQPQPQRTPLLN
jgi:hypothetical protein